MAEDSSAAAEARHGEQQDGSNNDAHVGSAAGAGAEEGVAAAAAEGKGNFMREGDWTCPGCSANVFGKNISCYRCQTPRPGTNARHGDWICLNKGCNAHNYASRQVCYRCSVQKGAEKPGDWPCPSCRANNFANRFECYKCRVPRPQGYGISNGAMSAVGSVRPGDWVCPNLACRANVFANRDSCFRCNTRRSADEQQPPPPSYSAPPPARSGDWTCPGCNASCFSHRQTCFRCDTPRPNGGVPSHYGRQNAPYPPRTSEYAPRTSDYAPRYPPNNYQSQNYGGEGSYNQFNNHGGGGFNNRGPNSRFAGIPGQGQGFRRREGDWKCSKCNEENFSKRTSCYKCHEPRVMDGHVGSGGGGGGEETEKTEIVDGRWTCTCGNSNAIEEAVCPNCETARGD